MTKFNLSAAQIEALENLETYLTLFGFVRGEPSRTLHVHSLILRGEDYEVNAWSTYELEASGITHDENGDEIQWFHA